MVPNVASSNLVTRPINKKNAPKGCVFLFIWSGQMRTGEAKFDKKVGENKRSAV